MKTSYEKSTAILLLVCVFSCGSKMQAIQQQPVRNYDSLVALLKIPQVNRKLCTPNSSNEAKALYRYLLDINGKKILSGQMWVPWSMDEVSYIEKKTGKLPAIKGVDFIHQGSNEAEVKRVIDWWNSGGIPTIMWHWGAPGIGEGYENSKKEIDIDKMFY
ncbi:MAG TPA: glycosyl hydrolase [Cyclobacteriaceae bacterium]|nr:glycosyl hydrolase [Cyclobacteriaceae bacterium]